MKHFMNSTTVLNFELKAYHEHTPIYKAVIDFLMAVTWGDIF